MKKAGEPSISSIPSVCPDDSDSSIDPDTLVPEFLELRSRLYRLRPDYFDQPKKGKKANTGKADGYDSDPQVMKIKRKLSKIENDVLFDRVEAEDRWKEKLNELRKEQAFIRQKERQIDAPSAAPSEKHEVEKQEAEPEEVPFPADDENASLFGDMFSAETSIAEPTLVAEPMSSSIQIRDFGKPTGLSPRRVLEETCKARFVFSFFTLPEISRLMNFRIIRDPGCTVTYKDISSSTYSNRKAVEVKWSKPQDIPFPLSLDMVTHKSNPYATFASMDTIATPTSQQAEGYISTLVLFLISAQNPKESKAYLRLPAVWRELWTELSAVKKQQEDEADKDTVRHLKKLVQENAGKFEDDVVLTDNFKKRNGAASQAESPSRYRPTDYVEPADQLTKLWMDKASTPAFQNMLRSRMNLPIWGFKKDILDTLATHQAVIICSETGSGKSTQIPSFILEHELSEGRSCKIYVTEPRRISAISLARRVSEELGESKNDVGTSRSLVGYAIRLESKISQSTRLVFAYVNFMCFWFLCFWTWSSLCIGRREW